MEEKMRITNEVLANELSNVGKNVQTLTGRFDNFERQYTRSDLLELRFKEIDTRMAQIELQIAQIKKETVKASWKSNTLTAIFTAVLVMLVTYVFNDLLSK